MTDTDLEPAAPTVPVVDVLPDIDAALHPDATPGQLLDAHITITAARDALGAVAADIKRRIETAGTRRRTDDGTEVRFKRTLGQAYDTHHAAVIHVDDPEACADWLADEHQDVHDQAVLVTPEVHVHNPATALTALVQRDCALLLDSVEAVDVTTVDPAALEQAFHIRGNVLADDDGQVVPGVSVTPRRFKGMTVKPDADEKKKLVRVFKRRITNAAAAADGREAIEG